MNIRHREVSRTPYEVPVSSTPRIKRHYRRNSHHKRFRVPSRDELIDKIYAESFVAQTIYLCRFLKEAEAMVNAAMEGSHN